MFNNEYSLALSKNYVMHWGLLEAVRELIQNSIDSNSPFNYCFEREDDDVYTLVLKSELSTLSAKTLLLGTTSKADSKDSIGSFGEGYKIAILVLTRLGNCPLIYNGDLIWRPSFKYNKKFGDDVLTITEEPNPFKNSGIEFQVSNLSEDDVEKIRKSCLQMQKSIGEVKETSRGQILLSPEHKGNLYVGGLYICHTKELSFGYCTNPSQIKLERDRQTVSDFDLRWLTKEMWIETKEFTYIAEMVESGCYDISLISYSTPEIVKEECYKLFRKNNPGAVAASSQKEFKELVAKGLQKVVYVNVLMGDILKQSKEYKSFVPMATETPTQTLERWFEKYKYNMHNKARSTFKSEILSLSNSWRKS